MKNKNKKLLSAVIMAIISVGFIGCNDDEDSNKIETQIDLYKNCEQHSENSELDDNIFKYDVDGNTLHFSRINWKYPCSFLQPHVSHEISADTIIVSEKWTGDVSANCLCERDLEYSVANIPSGQYKVRCTISCDDYNTSIVTLNDTVFNILIP